MANEGIHLKRFVRILRGGSQSILAEATDGAIYVVKFADNLQGRESLFNESAGTELYREFGLPVPEWRRLWVSEEFIDKNRDCWLETAHTRVRRKAGACFGSRFLGETNERIFEILPGSYSSRVENSKDFWLAWLVDVCADHADNRQAIFTENLTRRVTAIFIDHGHMFAGLDGNQRPPPIASRYLDPRFYPKLTAADKESVLNRFKIVNLSHFWNCIEMLPEEWKSDIAIRNIDRCLDRLPNILMLTDLFNRLANLNSQHEPALQASNCVA